MVRNIGVAVFSGIAVFSHLRWLNVITSNYSSRSGSSGRSRVVLKERREEMKVLFGRDSTGEMVVEKLGENGG